MTTFESPVGTLVIAAQFPHALTVPFGRNARELEVDPANDTALVTSAGTTGMEYPHWVMLGCANMVSTQKNQIPTVAANTVVDLRFCSFGCLTGAIKIVNECPGFVTFW